jgi:hypothetical protein
MAMTESHGAAVRTIEMDNGRAARRILPIEREEKPNTDDTDARLRGYYSYLTTLPRA